MSSLTSPAGRLELLSLVAAADRALWDLDDPQPAQRLAARNAAIRLALAAGCARQDVASALAVRPDDVDQMLHAHTP